MKNSVFVGQIDRFVCLQNTERRQVLAERVSWPADDNQMRESEQSSKVAPGLDLLVHVRADDEQHLRARVDLPHSFEGFYRVALFKCIHFYSRRSKALKRHR